MNRHKGVGVKVLFNSFSICVRSSISLPFINDLLSTYYVLNSDNADTENLKYK